MKRILAGLLTLALMAWLLRSGLKAPGSGEPVAVVSDDPGPEARVRSLLADAASGDVPGYLAAFAPELRARLEREADEQGRAAFAESLRVASRARKSHALFAPEADGPDAAQVVVEAIYPDRNERQTYRLERSETGWRIAGVETVRGHRPQARFGTPANYREPEGVPVQGPPGGDEPPNE